MVNQGVVKNQQCGAASSFALKVTPGLLAQHPIIGIGLCLLITLKADTLMLRRAGASTEL